MGNFNLINSKKNTTTKASLFENIRSKYILKFIFDHIHNRKLLEIIKYNNEIKKKLDLGINDYLEAHYTYSSIEIEIKPIKAFYDKFINYYNKNKDYLYHVYFNDSKNEAYTDNIGDNYVYKIRIKIDYPIDILSRLFYCCKCAKSIKFNKLYRSNIKDMSLMFNGCLSLKEINLSNVHIKNVTNMSYMFSACESLKKLNLSNINTDNVTDMSYMFNKCSLLEDLNISNFNTSKVTNMSSMFYGCKSLKKLDLSHFNTSNVTNFSYMFYECSALVELNISNFTKNNYAKTKKMYYSCKQLKKKISPNFSVSIFDYDF